MHTCSLYTCIRVYIHVHTHDIVPTYPPTLPRTPTHTHPHTTTHSHTHTHTLILTHSHTHRGMYAMIGCACRAVPHSLSVKCIANSKTI